MPRPKQSNITMKPLSATFGDGDYKLVVQWNQRSYDPINGGGISEYVFFFDDARLPKKFVKEMQQYISRLVHTSYGSKHCIFSVQGKGDFETMCNIGARTGHRCGYNYSPELFFEDDEAAAQYGIYDEYDLIDVSEETVDGFNATEFREYLNDINNELTDEHEAFKILVRSKTSYGRPFSEYVWAMKTPDGRFIVSRIPETREYFYNEPANINEVILDLYGE